MQKLTAETIKELGDRIKAGAFEQMAVQSLGISLETYQKWLNTKGGRRNSLPQQLRDEVMRARAHARLMAEMQLRTKEPKSWLLNGPGKPTAELPGWTSPVKAASIQDDRLRGRAALFRNDGAHLADPANPGTVSRGPRRCGRGAGWGEEVAA